MATASGSTGSVSKGASSLKSTIRRLYSSLDIPDNAIYKDVVIIGNGPSGIMTSYILAGNWPYYNGKQHVDEHLSTRLSLMLTSISIIQQDLRFLSQGLEGRSKNPVSVLVDALLRPGLDIGLDNPSLINWKYNPEHKLDHVVLGKGLPGGSWQNLHGKIYALSLASWMELPGIKFEEWAYNTYGSNTPIPPISEHFRPSVSAVARYYQEYIEKQNLAKYFKSYHIVTSVRAINSTDSQSEEGRAEDSDEENDQLTPIWQVEGYDLETNEKFCYISPQVVLATGMADMVKKLDVPGELTNPHWITHELRGLEEMLDTIVANEEINKDPVLIVGAGLSAADAVTSARCRSLSIIQLFRNEASDQLKQLPKEAYPEYYKVYQLMKGKDHCPCYTALAGHKVLEILSDRRVSVVGPNDCVSFHKVSMVVILIGSRPNLKFLPEELNLGVIPTAPVESEANPIDINPFKCRVMNTPPGLYALGPLIGDNFVRMLLGGAVAIVSDIYNNMKCDTF